VTRLVLASGSPRRRELLSGLGVAFDVRASDVDEETAERDPVRVAEGLALRKARAVAAGGEPDAVVLGSDTVVALERELLGKPVDAGEARAMLRALRGREHLVVTGVAVVAGGRVAADHARAAVTMRDYGDEEVEAFIASGAPFDKAGGYAIQDAALHPVAHTDGCECGVIGLPLWTVRRLLRVAAGVETSPPSFPRCAACPEREDAR
jgi:septum formation protein